MPLFTLRRSPHDDRRKTRGQDGSLLLSCRTLSFPTTCRFDPGARTLFAQRLNALSSITVREASHREPIQSGVAYIAPAGVHMRVERPSDSRATVCLDTEPDDRLHIPSVDILMESVAVAFKSRAMGVIMTGMGSDGAEGMAAIHRQGGFTIGQDEESCTVYGMPRVCAELGILNCVVPLRQIPAQILRATRHRRRA